MRGCKRSQSKKKQLDAPEPRADTTAVYTALRRGVFFDGRDLVEVLLGEYSAKYDGLDHRTCYVDSKRTTCAIQPTTAQSSPSRPTPASPDSRASRASPASPDLAASPASPDLPASPASRASRASRASPGPTVSTALPAAIKFVRLPDVTKPRRSSRTRRGPIDFV